MQSLPDGGGGLALQPLAQFAAQTARTHPACTRFEVRRNEQIVPLRGLFGALDPDVGQDRRILGETTGKLVAVNQFFRQFTLEHWGFPLWLWNRFEQHSRTLLAEIQSLSNGMRALLTPLSMPT